MVYNRRKVTVYHVLMFFFNFVSDLRTSSTPPVSTHFSVQLSEFNRWPDSLCFKAACMRRWQSCDMKLCEL